MMGPWGEGGGGYVPPEYQKSPEPEQPKAETPAVAAPSAAEAVPEAHHESHQAHEDREVGPPPSVPENEMQFTFSASGGPGGQNVNKVASKATLRWSVGGSGAFTEEQKALIREYAGSYLNKADEIILQSSEQRSQHQNRESVAERLQALVAAALEPKKLRKATKPSYSSKQKRLDSKSRDSRKKQDRRWRGDE